MEDRLKKFTQLVDAGSFVKAAHELHISQPALSTAIAKLERELHAPLLVHGVRPLALTAAGQLAYDAGKDMLVKASNLKTQLAELNQRPVTVSIGMIDSVASLLLATAENVDELERQASVSLVVDNSRNLLAAVEAGKLDMAFVVAQRQYAGAIEVSHRATEPLVMVCHAAQQREMNKALIAGVLPRFISYDQASTSHRLITDFLHQEHIAPEPVFYSTSPEVMLRLLLLKKGVAVLPYLLVREYIDRGDLALVGRPPLVIERPIVVVKRRDIVLATPLSGAVHKLVTMFGALRAEALHVA